MAHVKKYTLGASRKILDHCERENKVYKNEKIDLTRTCDNYSFEEFKNPKKYLKQRLSEVYCLKRKDINVMCSWVITLPEGLKPEDQNYNVEEQREMEKTFFQMSYEFLANRYGYRNVIMADVHYDETTPHLHFGFVPVVYDQKKQRYKVSAKEVVDRADLRSFHKDFEDYLAKEIYRDVQESNLNHSFEDCKSVVKKFGITNGKTKSLGGNRSIEQLKSENFDLEQKIEKNRAILQETEKNRLKAQNEAQKAKEKELEEVKMLEEQKALIQNHIEFLKAEEKKLEKNLNIDHKKFDVETFDPSKYPNLVAAKLDLEYQQYLQLLKNNDKDYIAERSFETYYKDNIVIAANNMQFTKEEVDILLNKENLLEELYDDWLDDDFDEMEGYFGSFEKTTEKLVDQHRSKESLLEYADISKKQKSISYEPEI